MPKNTYTIDKIKKIILERIYIKYAFKVLSKETIYNMNLELAKLSYTHPLFAQFEFIVAEDHQSIILIQH